MPTATGTAQLSSHSQARPLVSLSTMSMLDKSASTFRYLCRSLCFLGAGTRYVSMLSFIRTRAILKLYLNVQGSVLGDLGFYGKRYVSLTLSLDISLNCFFVVPSSFILKRRYVLQARLACAQHLTGIGIDYHQPLES